VAALAASLILLTLTGGLAATPAQATRPHGPVVAGIDLERATIPDLQQAMDKGRDLASRAGDTAGDALKTAGQKADQLAASVGERAHSAADAVRRHGPQEGMLGNATKTVADTIDQTGRYLQDEGLTGMMGDVGNMIKRNPIPALFVGIGIGYLLARALDRS
jgi:amidase